MRRTHTVAAAALTLVVGVGLLAGCRTGESTEPADEPTTEPTRSEQATPTTDPTGEAAPEPTATAAAVNGPNSITAPPVGGEVAGPTITVAGEGTGFEATLLYRVVAVGDTDVVAEGFTNAGANGEVGPYSFEVELEPGEYTVQVWEPGMGEGDTGGEPRNRVEVTFSVS